MIVMFDVTKKSTFDSMEMWFREATRNGGEHLQVFIVGTKTDLPNRVIQKKDGERYVKDRDQAGYYEISAKEGKGFIGLMGAISDT
jgi:GTPase SAR1 family protein